MFAILKSVSAVKVLVLLYTHSDDDDGGSKRMKKVKK